MPLKITKDRSNIDNLELSESANSTKDALYEWDSSYKLYNNIMGDILTIKDYKSLFY